MKVDGKSIGLRDRRKPGHGWYDNEIYDVFGDELRQDGISVYMTLTRLCYGVRVTVSLREMAAQARMSKDTFARNLKRVVALGLVIEQKGATAQSASTYELVDVKDLAAEYLRRMRKPESNCLTVRQVPVSQAATEVSQNEGGSATEVSQAVRHPLRQGHKDTQDTKTNTPLPPTRGGSGDGSGESFDCAGERLDSATAEGAGGADDRWTVETLEAAQGVMRELGFTQSRRILGAIGDALQARVRQTGCTLEEAKTLAIANANAFREDAHLLRYTWSWSRFFREAYWTNQNLWPYDTQKLERHRRRL